MEIQVFSLSVITLLNHALYLSFSQIQWLTNYPLSSEELQQKELRMLHIKLISS